MSRLMALYRTCWVDGGTSLLPGRYQALTGLRTRKPTLVVAFSSVSCAVVAARCGALIVPRNRQCTTA